MFQALKKLTSSKQDVVSPTNLESATPMSGSLQKKFSRGVNYNMKVILKGDRNVGKSCLFKRLQGGQFIETYTPTEEIQVASIQWSFKATEDIVKVEVWDVVDKGKARPKQTGLKLSTAAPIPENLALDAEFLDVYKGTHGVIIMFDITKAWTFDYVIRELPKVPADIPVLVLGNHCDMSHHRVISVGQAQDFVESNLEGRSSEIIYAESSMRNGFGLRLLHKFLGLPFLRLQKETFLALIERNARDTEICRLEIVEFLNCDDANYNSFLNKLSDKRRQVADSNSRVPPTSIPISNSLINSPASPNTPGIQTPGANVNTPSNLLRPTKSIIVGGGQPIVIPGQINITQTINESKSMTQNNTNNKIQESSTTKATALVSSLLKNADAQQQQKNNFNGSNNVNISAEVRKLSIVDQNQKLNSLEEFCPDDGGNLDRNFLDDIPNVNSPDNMLGNNTVNINSNNNADTDSDNDTVNPLVARFYDEPEDTEFESNDIQNSKSLNLPPEQKSTINTTKINPLAKGKNKRLVADGGDFLKLDNLRKNSYSSEEIPSISPDESHPNIQSYEENLDNWLTDTSIRRSPEGGEDTGSVPSISQDLNSSSESKISNQEKKSTTHHKKKKEKKDRDKDKSEKKEKKKKKRSKTSELEDFLNGTSDTNRIEEAYEAI
ncbi:rab-like protein 6 [Condylostylus longicornis]|uniref:rab-like protein 6 n=1 Tax=Condylostylus longicornis TaxID=2530218 RepID=UPI00244E43B5|nr:rab-like protein 6 [Condylostylus longicornis]